ncbi:MAG: hypothetical protein JW712_00430 [Dehalococcoidales bacterium]|nr:hypothetical protein [Dehalococcoidales bacterium]
MTAQKYANYIISEPKPVPPEVQAEFEAKRKESTSTIRSTHVMTVDNDIVPGMFYVDAVWMWGGSSDEKVEEPHVHEFDEVIAFIGSDQSDPQSLGGEITIWLDGEKHVLNKTCLIFVPAGAAHCPIIFNRIDKPIFFATISPSTVYTRKAITEEEAKGLGPKCQIIDKVAEFNGAGTDSPPPQRPPDSDIEGARVMHLEDHIAKGSFYVDFVWIYKGNGGAPAQPHNHDWMELIAMAVCDENSNELDDKMTVDLEGETYDIKKSSLVCIPAGVEHCPWKFIDIRKPVLVFTAGPSPNYTGSHRPE